MSFASIRSWFRAPARIEATLGRVEQYLASLAELIVLMARRQVSMERKLMERMEDILADENTEASELQQVAQGVVTLNNTIIDLRAQLESALSGLTIPPAVQAQIDQAFAGAETNRATVEGIITQLQAAITASQPAATGAATAAGTDPSAGAAAGAQGADAGVGAGSQDVGSQANTAGG